MKLPYLKKLCTLIPCLAGLLLIGAPSPSPADIYRYVDKAGVLHFTNLPTHNRYQPYRRSAVTTRSYNQDYYDQLIQKISYQYNIDPALVKAVIKTESNFDPHAVSKKGARGLMQLMPDTIRNLNVYDPFHPRDNINGGVKFLKQLLARFNHNLPLTLAAYNAGPEAVEQYDGIPPYQETQQYVRRVLNCLNRYRREL
jgi:soluble lytic murein transglycosylase